MNDGLKIPRSLLRGGVYSSGDFENLFESVHVVENLRVATLGFVGNGGGDLAQRGYCFIAPSEHTARVQEFHITIGT